MADLDRMIQDDIIRKSVMSSKEEEAFSKDVAEGLLISDEEFNVIRSKFLDFSASEPPEDAITMLSQLDAVALFNANARIAPLFSFGMILLIPVDTTQYIIKRDAMCYFRTKLAMLRNCNTLTEFVELRSEYFRAALDGDYAID